MIVFAIDCERAALDDLYAAVAEAEPHATTLSFDSAEVALTATRLHGETPDIVFCSIELSDVHALEFAKRLREVAPAAKLVFVSEQADHALEAFRAHADGFILAPAGAERIREELDALIVPNEDNRPVRMRVRCFGYFDAFVGTEPIIFSRTRTKELLAFLVDRLGGTCTGGEIITALWEGEDVDRHKSYLRVLTNDLRTSLAVVGLQDILIHSHGQWAVRKSLMDCDYFRLLEGDLGARKLFHGEYMQQYSWAEETAAKLHFLYA